MRIKGTIEKNIEGHVLLGEIFHKISNLIDALNDLENIIKLFGPELAPNLTYYYQSIKNLKGELTSFVVVPKCKGKNYPEKVNRPERLEIEGKDE